MDRWLGRVALVTGASSGIGAALALELAKKGMKVVGCARNVDRIKAISSQLEASANAGSIHAIKCDMRQEEDILAMFKEIKSTYGGVDVCVNNAGMDAKASLLGGDTDKWRELMEVNVLGLCICTREAFQSMKAKDIDDGHIINICSMSGHRVVRGGGGFYAATKYAVRALTEGVRHELREMKSHIRITEISPGVVETEFFERASGETAAKRIFKSIGEPLQPEDVAGAVLYALSAPPHVQVHDILMRPTNQVT